MLADLLPPEVAAVERFDDPPDVTLFPEEEAVVARAVDKRRREFATGRDCARAALARLGLPPSPIVPGERGAPRWPPGMTGSITHCDGYRAAAVARRRDILTVGVDAEPAGPLPEGVLALISLAAERDQLAELAASAAGVCWDRLLFSAKESVYKAWFPLTGRWLDFSEARVAIDPAAGTFAASLLVPAIEVDGRQLSGFTGRWLTGRGLVLTAIAVPARSAPRSPSAPEIVTA